MLQESIKHSPGEWLWQHNRWKQQTPHNLYKRFRHDCICIALPDDPTAFHALLPHLSTLKKIYPRDFLFLLAPIQFKDALFIEADEILSYRTPEELLLCDYRFKLVFNFTSYPLAAHYERFSVFEVIDLPTLRALAAPHLPPHLKDNLSEIFLRSLCRPGTTWQPEASDAP